MVVSKLPLIKYACALFINTYYKDYFKILMLIWRLNIAWRVRLKKTEFTLHKSMEKITMLWKPHGYWLAEHRLNVYEFNQLFIFLFRPPKPD
jgi:hypothetical protein